MEGELAMSYLRCLSRRKVATWTALGAALTCAGAMAVPGVTRAQPISIRHVVVIYLENHSFDNVLGFWCDAHRGRCPDGGMPSSVRLSNGAVVTPRTAPNIVPPVKHDVASQLAAIHGGRMDGWENIPGGSCSATTGYRCISGYQPAQVPNITALAQQFAISDRTFSMADSPSWGGHVDMVTASADGFLGNNPVKAEGVTAGPGWGCDSGKVTPWVSPSGAVKMEPSCIPDNSLGLRHGGAFRATPVEHIPTILDRLSGAHLSWRIYGASKQDGGSGTLARGYAWSICPSLADCLYTSQKHNLVPSAKFQNDALRGKLPAFAVVTPGGATFTDSCHNSFSMTACDNWVGSLVSSVEFGPDWRSTAVFITWDDCGCFYDQVRPGVNPDGTAQGPRVPLIIVSPYARPGFTDTTATTFTGILAFTERTFGLRPLGVNDAAAYPFSHAFSEDQRPLRPVPMTHRPLPPSARHIHLTRALEDDPT
jgi:phospholipase C